MKVIRRYRLVDGKPKWESYPKDKYKDLSGEEVEALIRRLNASIEAEEKLAKERYDYDNAFVNKVTKEEFERRLRNKATDEGHIQAQMTHLDEYVLRYFIFERELADPNQWKKVEDSYGDWLQNVLSESTGNKLRGTTIARIIQTANRFLEFLHNRMPDEVRLIKLDPISHDVLEERDSLSVNRKRKKFITEKDFESICKKADPRIVPLVKIGYWFGLRRSECLGLTLDDVFEDALHVERQLVKTMPTAQYDRLKDKDERDVPYWFCKAETAYELVSQIQMIHPDTVSDLFSGVCEELKLPFQFHDLRRTWITRALRVRHFMDVRLAAGHEDLETTQGYIQDDREIQRKKFVPK